MNDRIPPTGAVADHATPTCAWTAESVAAHVAATPTMDWSVEDDQTYRERYVRNVAEFGLTIRLDPIVTADKDVVGDRMPVQAVPVDLIRSSTQSEGVCLDVIDHYVKHPDDLIDTEGWFDNQLPVLFIRTDGTYTVRDGNHRCIAAILRGDTHLQAHVVP